MHKHFLRAVFLSWALNPFMQSSSLKVSAHSCPNGSGTYQLKRWFKRDHLRARLTCLQSCRPLCCTAITRWTETSWRITPALTFIILDVSFCYSVSMLHSVFPKIREDSLSFTIQTSRGVFYIYIFLYTHFNLNPNKRQSPLISSHLAPPLKKREAAVGEKPRTPAVLHTRVVQIWIKVTMVAN